MRSFKPYVEFRLTETKITLKNKKGYEIFIEISPGSSFGSEHTTTRLCLRAIEEIFKTRSVKTALDFGCGSGVLGICAAALGAESVLAVDIDPMAVKEAGVNFERNKLNSKGHVQYGSLEDVQGKFDLVIANIVTDELLGMVAEIESLLEKNGILLVSGIYETKKEKAITGFSNASFRFTKEYIESGWTALWFDWA
ncbi:50S ribosomal protein L11 methyltransferase [Desulfobacterota bacterium AH_259_B03_O07]|nr:50S ribosomal protein L11 methyltransferase [Desulfobacterota bacterium AH_259_B03_O07]